MLQLLGASFPRLPSFSGGYTKESFFRVAAEKAGKPGGTRLTAATMNDVSFASDYGEVGSGLKQLHV